jgi:hypothetical protein
MLALENALQLQPGTRFLAPLELALQGAAQLERDVRTVVFKITASQGYAHDDRR